MNKFKFICVILLTLILCTACGNSYVENNSTSDKRDVTYFEKDRYTVKKEEYCDYLYNTNYNSSNYQEDEQEVQSTEDKDDVQDVQDVKEAEDIAVSEILLYEDDSINFTVDGDNIVYNNITFYNLYSHVNSIELPCDINTFINFIIKTYPSDSDAIVYLSKESDEEQVEEEDVGSYLTLHDTMLGYNGYQTLYEKYNKPINWYLAVVSKNDSKTLDIYGCDKYLMYIGNNTLNIDTSELGDSTYSETDDNIEAENEADIEADNKE